MIKYLKYVLLLVAAISASCAFGQSERKINWTDSLEFDWDLFEEKKKGYSYIKAMTYSGIMYDVDVVNDQIVIDISAYFVYGKSWVLKGYKKPKLLKHEKTHFDIAEIYKRKLDKLCDKYRVSYTVFVSLDYQKALQRDFDRIFEEMNDYQEKYDLETKHGTKYDKQAAWENRIKLELSKS